MALIKCPECGKSVSALAESCPNCGYPLNACSDELKKDQMKDENNPDTADNLKKNLHQLCIKEKKLINSKFIIIISIGIIVLLAILIPAIIIPSIHYSEAVSLIEEGDYTQAKLILYGLGNFKDAKKYLNQLEEAYPDNIITLQFENSTMCLKKDGTVATTGGDNKYGELDVSEWKDIIEISSGMNHTVGLRTDGTVLATGDNEEGQCDVSDWKDIVQISAFFDNTVGLKKDGTVLATGKNYAGELNIQNWTDIVKVCVGDDFTCGLKKDGTVVVAGDTESNEYTDGIVEITRAKNVVDISCSVSTVLALKSDGTAEIFGEANYETIDSDISEWRNIIKIYAGISDYFGLKKDGSVVAVSDFNKYGECDVKGWNDVVSIANDGGCTVGVRRNGTVLADGDNEFGQCNAKYMTNIGKYTDY